MKKINLKINGMHCTSCSKLVEDELEDNGISSKVDFETGIAVINFNENRTSEKQIKDIILKLGYKIK